ncbi:pseudouridine synthase [Pontibacter sp. 13R65]|uniref:pseudouridine synthase n=1 Tax=Pontibacter sp. 13R65 TaxID=3127458 RepID=UPI00301D462E
MKSLTSSLKHFVVQKARISNKEAVQCILSGRVLVNGSKAPLDTPILPTDKIQLDGQVLKQPTKLIYLAFHKPRGIESTLNPQIENNLLEALKFKQTVFPVGRLDKDSEGLMLLTNNGKIFDKILHSQSHQEKEYEVTVDQPLTELVLESLAAGVEIMGKRTRPALVTQVSSRTFRITLTQGLNRQIRRMCYKLGYQVTRLIRTRIITLQLENLPVGQWRYLQPAEIDKLFEKVHE